MNLLEQVGVLAFREDPEKGLQFLLITSRGTGRWVVPRGNMIGGLDRRESAGLEAYEEAGIEGEITTDAIGHYPYLKRRRNGGDVEARVSLFGMRVTRHHFDWPERRDRTVRWYSRRQAAMAVEEAELKALIEAFDPERHRFASREAAGKGHRKGGAGKNMLKLVKAIMPREDRYFDLFGRHADLLVAGAEAMLAMFDGTQGIPESCRRIAEHETAADDVTRDVLVAVRRSFITPFDRSAITALASSIDTAIDEMWQTAKAITLYEVESFEPQMLEMSQLAVEGSELVREAIPLLRNIGRNGSRLHEITEKIVHLEGRADDLHEKGLKILFKAHGEDRAMSFLVGREVYRHLERVLDSLEDVADEITGIVIDHA